MFDYDRTASNPGPLDLVESLFITTASSGRAYLRNLNNSKILLDNYTVHTMLHSNGTTSSHDAGIFIANVSCNTRHLGTFAMQENDGTRFPFGTWIAGLDYFMRLDTFSNNTAECLVWAGQLNSSGEPNYTNTIASVDRIGSNFVTGAGIVVSGDNVETMFDNTTFCVGIQECAAPVTVSLVSPSASQVFGLSNITGGININVTYDGNNVNCQTNDTDWINNSNTTNTWSFINGTSLSDGTFHVEVTCYEEPKSNGINESVTATFIVDLTNPIIVPQTTLGNNKTIVANGTLQTNINFTDNNEIYSVNVTFQNGSIIF